MSSFKEKSLQEIRNDDYKALKTSVLSDEIKTLVSANT